MRTGAWATKAKAAVWWVGLTGTLTLGLSGCRHKPVLPALPPITQPMELATVPPPATPPMIETPQVKLPPVPVATGAHPRTSRRRRSPAVVSAPASSPAADPPAEAPAQTAAEVTAIGALSSGGDSNSHAQQEAADLIGSIDKRLSALPAQKAEAEKAQISKVRNFQRQAQEALTSGDLEGAKTLATKAKLLLDDLEK
ncbi:hypothetical protein [Edaphobacter aggregans]|uniref:hypothetical protein n=1 Tax=Edaphobacter aggregans TaxID=570835 RepID=UPI000556568F|nr:hypothetical protein [Edaphobacter aggregans]